MVSRNFDGNSTLHYADYIILGLMLGISMAIGVYYAYLSRKQKSFKEYFTASGNMKVLPTAFSLIASVLCSIWYIGVPAEVYNYGFHFIYDLPMVIVAVPVVSYGFLPVFYELKLTSCNEYLERRFNIAIRRCGSVMYLLNTLVNVALVMFIPALSISQVTGFHLWISILAMCIVGTIYTALGGIRAVMWTDVFQMLIIYSSMLAVVVKGTIDAGGVREVFVKAVEGRRIAVTPLSFDPRLRYNLPMILVGCFIFWVGLYGVLQTQIQRYVSCPTINAARRALWWNVPAFLVIEGIILYIGFVLYATYKDCDPISNGSIETADELLTFYVIDTFGKVPGLPGLFVAGVFSGALSTISSCLNSMAAVTMEDFVKAIPRLNPMKEVTATILSRWIAFFYGMFTIVIMILVEKIESVLAFGAYNLGAVRGCTVGLFCLGLFFPWSNSLGAGIGVFVSLSIGVILGIGGQIYGTQFPTEVMSTDGCNGTFWNSTMSFTTTPMMELPVTTVLSNATHSKLQEIFKLSPYIIETFTFVTVMIFGGLSSLLTGCKSRPPVNPELISPFLRSFLKTGKSKSCIESIDASQSQGKKLQDYSLLLKLPPAERNHAIMKSQRRTSKEVDLPIVQKLQNDNESTDS